MEYTIQEMIAHKGRVLEETDYVCCNRDMLNFRLISGDFYEWNGGKLHFKQCADVMDFQQAAEAFPPVASVQYKSREKFPYFVGGLDTLTEAMERGETIAVEGGPCLFGEHEVTVSVRLKDGGEERLFDYANGKAYLELEEDNFSETEGLADYLRLNGERVERIDFQQNKQGLTPQEYLNLRYPFEIAAALRGPLVVPIPDMSYRKYLEHALDTVPEGVRKRTLEKLDEVLNQIADLYLNAIAELQARFQIERFACVHRRDPEIMETWHEKRVPYIERRKILRHITRNPEKLESIKDYISMPALPLYLFGARNILEVNIMTEADSYRKCKAAHGEAVRMGCFLFPELFSGDGIHMFYFAPLQWKEYGNYEGYESPA